MKRQIDLDQVADLIDTRRPDWSNAGLTAEPCTWMAEDAPWPQQLVNDRTAINSPRSVGVIIRNGEAAEAQLVFYAGGWADADYVRLAQDEAVSEYVEIDNIATVEQLLERISRHIATSD